MKRRIVNDEQAVSPVIAVILMVAITVVLAAVLYVWASSFLGGTTKNAPTGSMIASEDGSGVWTIQIVKINPQVSVNSVHWYLLDEMGNTKTDGLVSDVYGYYAGNGKAVVFVDNDFNGKLSPGDKFEANPGETGSDLESVSEITDYSFRLKFEPTGDVIGYDLSLQA
jgi:flagellin-like protein